MRRSEHLRFGKYSIEGVDDLNPSNGETAHGGFDPVYANDDLDRVIPVDVLRKMEKNGEIGSLFNYYTQQWVTVLLLLTLKSLQLKLQLI